VADVIYAFNTKLLELLSARIKNFNVDTQFGDVIIQMKDFLKIYTSYINNYNTALTTYETLMRGNTEFNHYIAKCDAKPEHNGLKFDSFLIMPIQRIPRYVLLLEDLVKSTYAKHPDFNNLASAWLGVKEIATIVNESKKEFDSLSQVIRVYHVIQPKIQDLIVPARKLLLEGDLIELRLEDIGKIVHSEMFHYFLFNDLLLLAKPAKDNKYKLMNKIPLLGSFDVKSIDDNEYMKTAFELRGNGKTHVLAMKTAQEKSTFITTFQQSKNDLNVHAEKRAQPAINKAKQYIEQRYKKAPGASSDNPQKPEDSPETSAVNPRLRTYKRTKSNAGDSTPPQNSPRSTSAAVEPVSTEGKVERSNSVVILEP